MKNLWLLVIVLVASQDVIFSQGVYPLSASDQPGVKDEPKSTGIGFHRAAPVNDDCADYTSLTIGDTLCSQTTDQGSTEGGEVTSGSCITTTFGETVWYRFTATSSTMYVDVAVTGLASNGTWCPSRFTVVVYNSTSCLPASGNIIGCETTGSDDVIVVPLTGLTAGNTYTIQIGYNDANGCKSPVFCITVGNTEASCGVCSVPCGSACEFSTPPSNPPVDVPAACAGDTLKPRLEGSDSRSLCYTFTAQSTSVDWGIIVLTNCTGGNSNSLTWQLQPSVCSGIIQSGSGFSFPTLTSLTAGTEYTLCYTITTATSCWHSIHWPYFVVGTLLPLELISFDAFAESGTVRLNWTGAGGINSSKFVVQRSLDGVSWIALAEITAENGSWNTDYEWVDVNPPLTVTYYRLQLVDNDGTSSFSHVRRVEILPPSPMTMFVAPNPTGDELKIVITSTIDCSGRLEMVDASGRLLDRRELDINAGTQTLPMSVIGHSSAHYVVRLITSLQSHAQTVMKL